MDSKFVGVALSKNEANEIFAILESILRDNTPESDEVDGEELVANCLMHNDPEMFRDRNKAYVDAMEQFSQMQGFHFEPETETFSEAEDEYGYLAMIANIYCKLIRAGAAA